ncbi:hypothetical protein EYF80_059991 [Liparis tanakae]|uniref:Uncharacterized protein n=1 Tax=Liparis tanakae TaxID=230148 RepID=A0A4Z2EM49_9TELE|nr:hypothetical protein EYF80_059991 [Liparis tanakae]
MDFLKLRPVRLGTIPLALDTVLSTAAGATVVGFTPPSGPGGFTPPSGPGGFTPPSGPGAFTSSMRGTFLESECPAAIEPDIPRGRRLILELSVLWSARSISSRAEIIFSIWARLSGPAVPGPVLSRPALCPAVMVLVVVLSVTLVVLSTPAALGLRSQCLRQEVDRGTGGRHPAKNTNTQSPDTRGQIYEDRDMRTET